MKATFDKYVCFDRLFFLHSVASISEITTWKKRLKTLRERSVHNTRVREENEKCCESSSKRILVVNASSERERWLWVRKRQYVKEWRTQQSWLRFMMIRDLTKIDNLAFRSLRASHFELDAIISDCERHSQSITCAISSQRRFKNESETTIRVLTTRNDENTKQFCDEFRIF